MWLVSLRDLQWRRRRFGAAVAGTSLVFALTLVLSGVSASIRAEPGRALEGVRADAWLVPADITGPFTSVSVLLASRAEEIGELPGIQRADPFVLVHQAIYLKRLVDVNLFGYRKGGVGEPKVVRGRTPGSAGEVVADESLGLPLGAQLPLGSKQMKIVGLTHGITLFAGQPVIFVLIEDAQDILARGLKLATAIITRGTPNKVPSDLKVMTNGQVRADLMRPFGNALATIDLVRILLWIVALSIVGLVIYISALERVRDFAVMKATGSSTFELLVGLALQAIILALGAAVIAGGLALLLGALFPLPVEIPVSALIALPAIAVVIGLVASMAGLRRAVSVDPALAFGGR
jgi:putative ABC transport system permease protein